MEASTMVVDEKPRAGYLDKIPKLCAISIVSGSTERFAQVMNLSG